jgi:murein DD-endopeptidase MepM/ murein hydrolase activator NlpD
VQDRRIAAEVADAKLQAAAARAKTKKLRVRVNGETAMIEARATQARDVRDELVGARNDLAGSRRQRLTDLSQLSSQDRADAQEIDALQAASAALTERIRAAQGQSSTTTASSAGLVWPVSGPVTSPFGWRWGRLHEGIDIGVSYGTPIHAAASGTVIYCGWESGYGNLTVLDHGGNLATAYGHQSSIAVSWGQHVTQGDVIGYVGSTGHSTGPHLHFEVRVNGSPVDPMGYL